jgi:hypothetical protein
MYVSKVTYVSSRCFPLAFGPIHCETERHHGAMQCCASGCRAHTDGLPWGCLAGALASGMDSARSLAGDG